MPRFDENCKASVVDIARSTTGTPTAKLLAVLIAAGVTDNRELAQITGLSVRSIQHARATHCASDATHCAQPIAQRNPLREETQPIAPDAQSIALARDLQRAQATKASLRDTSSNIHFHPSFRPDARERESEAPADGRPASFNDATESMIADVLKFMGPTASRQNAEKWLSGTLSVYGTDRTTRAWTALVAKQARNEPVSQPLALWAKTAGGLKPQAVAPKGADPTTFHLVSPSTVRFAKPREEVGHA
jgi:hypothetical protein